MILGKVHYVVDDGDMKSLMPVLWEGARHVFDYGEVKLTTKSNNEAVFVSWAKRPMEHCIGLQNMTFLHSQEFVTAIDVSQTALWKNLIGRDVKFRFIDNNHLALAISSRDLVVYCCAYDGTSWAKDVINLGFTLPDGLYD